MRRSIQEAGGRVVGTEDSRRIYTSLPRGMVGFAAECWEGNLGFVLLSGWER